MTIVMSHPAESQRPPGSDHCHSNPTGRQRKAHFSVRDAHHGTVAVCRDSTTSIGVPLRGCPHTGGRRGCSVAGTLPAEGVPVAGVRYQVLAKLTVGASSANRNDPSSTTVSGMNQIPEISSAWNCSCSNAATKNTTVSHRTRTVPTPARVTSIHHPAVLLMVVGQTRITATVRTLIAPGMVAWPARCAGNGVSQ